MFKHEMADKKIYSDEICRSGGGLHVDDIDCLNFEPYEVDGRKGVSIFHLYDARDNAQGPVAALVRYAGGALTPRHRHQGWELVLVVDGELVDDRGRHTVGALQIYPPGSTHQLSSVTGCTFLVVWEQPVQPSPTQGSEAAA
ncbi:cupin domain-containing protein [Pseudomonas haemolytica]|nr:cupin domain-containing protein [Pseudomonas haemolytica]MBJ2244883.1 cupin domain-containing protein [Pseudomonas haemolytica]MBJ2275267.1 cupin domain-containing protein [Pseudomonas haemolytica]MBK3446556.1 cupin domain-containing protein [Pseudomonas haemolytica]MBK3458052.1 cupin domain-containing protein [Pseudomonas haemolytica]